MAAMVINQIGSFQQFELNTVTITHEWRYNIRIATTVRNNDFTE